MKKVLPILFITILLTNTLTFAQNLLGFDTKNVQKQLDLETKFDARLNAKNLQEWMKQMSSKPHYVGSPHDRANAVYMRDLFRD